MNKKDWEEKLKEFQEMLKKAETNKSEVEKQIEELCVFIGALRGKIETFK